MAASRSWPGWLRLGAAAAAALVLASSPLGAAPTVAWPLALYNPKPQPDDVLVPLPCGGAMAFRRVPLPVLGAAPAGAGERLKALTGVLGGTDRSMLMGKYEVNQAQADALNAFAEGRPCPPELADVKDSTAVRTLATARGQISWQAANGLTSDLAGWLQTGGRVAPDCPSAGVPAGARSGQERSRAQPGQPPLCVPRANGQPLPVRLPQAAEWEFAARGGDAVSAGDFERSLYPMSGAVESHAWVSGNARGEVQPIGQLAPNPLGLHDVYGNVDEMLAETRTGETRHGFAPVFVTRGGSRYSSAAELGAVREEVEPLYDDRGQLHTSATGLRLGIGKPPGIAPPAPSHTNGIWTPPVPIAEVRPRLPQGTAPPTGATEVTARFTIDAKGVVSRVRMADGVAPSLRQPVEDALMQWEFDPARQGDRPTETVASVRARFLAGAGIGEMAEPLYGDASEPVTYSDPNLWSQPAGRQSEPVAPAATDRSSAGEVESAPVVEPPALAPAAGPAPATDSTPAPQGLSVRLFEWLRPKAEAFPPAYAWLYVLFSLAFVAKLLQWPGLSAAARLSVIAPQLQPMFQARIKNEPDKAAEIQLGAAKVYSQLGVRQGWIFASRVMDLALLLWVAFTFDHWSARLTADEARFFWVDDLLQSDGKVLVLWLMIGLVSLNITSRGNPLAFVGGMVGLVLLALIAWWLDWPAYVLVFWMLLILVGTALQLFLVGKFRNLRVQVGARP